MKPPRSSAQAEASGSIPDGKEGGVSHLTQRLRATFQREWAVEARLRTGFLWLPVVFGVGIVLYYSAREEPALWAGPASLILAMALAWATRATSFGRVALVLVFLALGFSAASYRTNNTGTPMLARQGIYEASGFVESIDATPRRHRIVLSVVSLSEVEANTRPLRLRLGVPGAPDVRPGDFVTLKARVGPPSEAAMPGGYDFRREAYFRGIGGVGYVLGRVTAATSTTEASLGLRVFARIDHARNIMTERIAKAIGGEAGALAAALVTGKRGLIGERTNEDLRASGLYHIVSISGLHMVLAAGVFFWTIRAFLAAIPRFALRYPIKKIAAGAAMLGAIAYCLFTGSEVATERSLIMILVMLGAILVDRPALAMRNLAISALIVLAREPEALLGPSFQMSYAAVAALIAANQIWQDWRGARDIDEKKQGSFLPGWLVGIILAFLASVATTAVASLATAPFGLAHFHRLNPLGIIGNTLAIPLVSLIVMPSAVAGTVLLPFGLDHFVWMAMGEGVRGVLFVAEKVAQMEGAVIAVPRMPVWLFALIIAGILIFVGLQSRLRWLALLLMAIWLLAMRAAPIPEIVIDGEGRLMLARGDAGQYRVMAQGKPSEFVLGQWLPALGDARLPADPALKQGASCDASGCVTRLASGGAVVLALKLDGLRADCQKARLIITPLIADGACEVGAKVLDRRHFERFGATRLIASEAGWTFETARNPDRQRPWMRSVVQNNGQNNNQPAALAEQLPQKRLRNQPSLSAEDDPALDERPQ